MALKIRSLKEWRLVETCFYTRVPDAEDNPFGNHFRTAKLAPTGRHNIRTFFRSVEIEHLEMHPTPVVVDKEHSTLHRFSQLRAYDFACPPTPRGGRRGS